LLLGYRRPMIVLALAFVASFGEVFAHVLGAWGF
jgi:hypothetical protein